MFGARADGEKEEEKKRQKKKPLTKHNKTRFFMRSRMETPPRAVVVMVYNYCYFFSSFRRCRVRAGYVFQRGPKTFVTEKMYNTWADEPRALHTDNPSVLAFASFLQLALTRERQLYEFHENLFTGV